MKISTRTLAGVAMLASLAVVLDYTMKYSGLKIPFPWNTKLKFDFTGIPIALSLLTYGFIPGLFTSIIALVAIVARSGDLIGATMKAAAELATIAGMVTALRMFPKQQKTTAFILGITTRCLTMFALNLIVQPAFYGISFEIALATSPLIAAFNAIQGTITIIGGYTIHETIKKRTSLHASTKNNQQQRKATRNNQTLTKNL
jgi:riboflavin transporter FmnP